MYDLQSLAETFRRSAVECVTVALPLVEVCKNPLCHSVFMMKALLCMAERTKAATCVFSNFINLANKVFQKLFDCEA